MRIILLLLGLFSFLSVSCPESGAAFELRLFPTDEELAKYRKMWNPFSHGPMLIQAPDVNPKGQFAVRPFVFSQIAEHEFGNTLTTPFDHKPTKNHLYSVQSPFVTLAYGITNHLEFVGGTSLNVFWSRNIDDFNKGRAGPWQTNTGLGDSSVMLKHRFIIQDPDTWRPTITFIHAQLSLPTGQWFTATHSPPGGFSPLGRFAATSFGALGVTESVLFRKNIQPFRFSGQLSYSYSTPGSTRGINTYTGDLINSRLIFEHFLNDKKGLAYMIELATLHGTTWRADGHAINSGKLSGFDLIGIEPAIQWRFGDTNLVGAAGVLFTVAGRNSLDSIYPNFSVFYFFAKKGQKVLAR
jgi:hypothetical protein